MKEFENLNLDIILTNWEACMVGHSFMERKVMWWRPPPEGVFKFKVDRAARGKPRLAGIVVVFFTTTRALHHFLSLLTMELKI